MDTATWVDPDAKPRATKVRITEFFNRYASAVGRASADIQAAAETGAERRDALEWQIDAISLAQETALRTDPLAALFDTWVLCAQMREYLTVGPGRERFGDAQPFAVEAFVGLERQMEEMAGRVCASDDLQPLRGMVDKALEAHPLRDPVSTREAPILDYVDEVREATDLTEIAASLEFAVTDLSRRASIYSVQLPRQARWEIQRTLGDDLEVISSGVDRLATVAEQVPDLVREEHGAVVALVGAEREALVQAVNQQRAETLTAVVELVRDERAAVLEAVAAERGAVVEALTAERMAIVETVHEQRRLVLASVSEMYDEGFPRAEGLIDHAFARVVQVLVGILLVVLLVGAGVLIWRRSGAGQPGSAG